MATVSSMLDLQDGFSKTIDNAVNAMNRLTASIDTLNRAVSIPNMDRPFTEIHTEAGAADTSVDHLTVAVDKLIRGMEDLQMSSRMDNVDKGFEGVRSEILRTNEQLDKLNNNFQKTGNHSKTVAAVTSSFGGLSRAILVANNGIQLMQTALQSVGQLGSQADQRIGVDARLSLINDGLQTQAGLEAKVMAASNATRTSYAATAALVAQMGRQDYFKNNNEKAIQFASTINKGLVVSGAGASEAAGAITQLNQGLASGVLRGDEFNSIMENAPILAEMMTKSMGITKGKLREMAEDGKLTTDVVVSSIMAQSSTLDQQFSKMPMTFGQATTIMGNDMSQLMDYLSQPGHAVDILIQKIEEMTAYLNTPQGTAMVDNIAAGLTTAANVLSWFFTLGVNTYQFFADNWSWIGPIFWGIAAAIGIATAANLIYNAVNVISQGIELAGAVAKAVMTGATLAKTDATAAETAAQWGLNSAMLASPITWIIAAVILLIVVIYAVVGAINQATGSSISATGVICGAFAAAGAFIWNTVIGVLNAIIQMIWTIFVEPYLGIIEWVLNVTNGGFNSFGDAVANLIGQVISWFLSLGKVVTKIIDAIFGTNWTAGLSSLQDSVLAWGKNDTAITIDRKAPTLGSRIEYGSAYNAGYKVGQGIDTKVSGLMNSVTGLSDQLANLNKSATGAGTGKTQDFGTAYKNPTGGKIDKVGKVSDAVDISDQSLEYLNDIAATAALSRFDSYQTLSYEQANDLQLSRQDADALRASANSSNNIYYLNYSGGALSIKNDVKKGEDWEDIKAKIHDETESAIETGLSGIDEVVSG
ncbi:tape measure protein [Faecalispora anaeroviscerum]|uniref:tape measure protein n=1 Tax=Faecalispora anaeroviscerum TaxID=2991836 RepID=UPI0024BA44DE|nr:tape measure protein [Faecalispora anaeroviscerum]